jgi:type IV secretory pathway component VirB8
MKQDRIKEFLPVEVRALLAIAKSRRAQSSLEYIMMIAAASVVIVLALAMVVKLKGAVVHNLSVNGTSMSISQAISNELGSLASNAV